MSVWIHSRRKSVPGLVHVIRSRGNGEEETDVRVRKLFSPLVCHHILIGLARGEKCICTRIWEGV